jgi:hypothetical protein
MRSFRRLAYLAATALALSIGGIVPHRRRTISSRA